jgi:hypothetical protein
MVICPVAAAPRTSIAPRPAAENQRSARRCRARAYPIDPGKLAALGGRELPAILHALPDL